MKSLKQITCSVTAIIAVIVGGATSTNTPSSLPQQVDAISREVQSVDDWQKPIGMVEISGIEVGELIVSPRALELIGNAEGCRKTPYKCPAGLATDGIGNTHTVTGAIKSDEEIAADWTRNIITSQNCLATSGDVSLMTQGQIDAFTSFIFNTGCTVFRHNKDGSETRIFKHIRQGNYKNACNELRVWVYGAGKKLPGLVKRRQKEMELCFAN